MNLSKEQIAEIVNEFFVDYPATDLNPLNLKTFLTEKFGAKEESWPTMEDGVYFINSVGEIKGEMWGYLKDSQREGLQSIGNIYRTKEEAENKVALLKHIYKFPEPKKGEEFWSQKDDLWDRFYYDHDWVDKQKYNSSGIMPLSSTEEDRAERIDLLKKCFS